jgi:hypothetical protein
VEADHLASVLGARPAARGRTAGAKRGPRRQGWRS